jgi:hypothetical protein
MSTLFRFKFLLQPGKACLFFFTLFFCASISCVENQILIKNELEKCLQVDWGVDKHTAAYISNKFNSLIENNTYHSIIKDFIFLSKKQNINFIVDKELRPLHSEDGILKAPKEHLVVFESPFVRILWGTTAPGARENFHEHPWKSVMLIVKPTTYEIEYPDGKKETLDYPIGVFELPAGERYACTNLGKSADASLRFEVKD